MQVTVCFFNCRRNGTEEIDSLRKRTPGENELVVAKSPSDFSFTVTKTAIAQICQSVGDKRTQLNAPETLTDVATKYLQSIAKSAVLFSNAANRTESNFFDIINAIHDLYSLRGFPGGSEMHKRKLLSSGALKEIMKFVNHSKEVPFAKPVPRNNILPSSNPEPSIDSGLSVVCCKESNMQGLHIPRWLPDFPDESLYKNCHQVRERKCGEKLWEHLVSAEGYGGNVKENGKLLESNGVGGKEGKEKRMEMAKERERVKFKIGGEEEKLVGLGVNMMNLICKGGKRVRLNHYEIDDFADWEK
ncbi:hypothetical protein L6164_036883 [Bauhinia variegata]|uniref:Uncharacterized protein n=1 Tax=Bauhinia variegata TaxID=167791 RepID=A0ACB9KIG0_BAUVA|nr:hypothetical protein L6164_036883 [Bauhinia variegata]